MTASFSTIVAAVVSLTALLCIAFGLARLQNFRLFRGYQNLTTDLNRIAQKLRNGKIARDKDDIMITGDFEAVPFSIRFSHSESTPGMYIRCAASVDFSVTFEPKTAENKDAVDICRIGNTAFDMRFVGRTDHRPKTRMLLAQPNCSDHIQQLCCSGKTMLRLSGGAIELSEALIPDDTARHVCTHLESMLLLNRQLASMPGARQNASEVPARRLHWLVKPALAASLSLTVIGWFLLKQPTKADATSQPVLDGISSSDRPLIPNLNGWKIAAPSDLNTDFLSWLKDAGADPAAYVRTDSSGSGTLNGAAYFLKADTDSNTKRVVWIVDHRVLFDTILRADGITRIPKANIVRASWAEGKAPGSDLDGDGLLVVRDSSKPDAATVYYTSQGALHTAVPADYRQLSLR